MEKIIYILLFCPLLLFSQLKDSIRIKTKVYEIMYSETLEEPLWIIYTVQCSEGNISRKGLDFHTNDSIKTSDDKDYAFNDFDKGHMAPAADFNCNTSYLQETFSYLNCALQHKKLNRGVWKSLEMHERELAKTHKVKVVIKLKFSPKSKQLKTGAYVPDGFYKTLYLIDNSHPPKYSTIKYYFPNVAPGSNKLSDYIIK